MNSFFIYLVQLIFLNAKLTFEYIFGFLELTQNQILMGEKHVLHVLVIILTVLM